MAQFVNPYFANEEELEAQNMADFSGAGRGQEQTRELYDPVAAASGAGNVGILANVLKAEQGQPEPGVLTPEQAAASLGNNVQPGVPANASASLGAGMGGVGTPTDTAVNRPLQNYDARVRKIGEQFTKGQENLAGLSEVNTQAKIKAINEQAAIDKTVVKRQAEIFEQQDKELTRLDAAQTQKRDIFTREIDAARKKYETYNRMAAAGTVDPERLMNKTSNKILAAIGMTLDVLGSAMAGRGTLASAKILQDNIDRDIELQKDDIERNRKAANAYLQQSNEFSQAWMTEQEAFVQQKMVTKERYARAAEAIANKFKDTKIGLEAQKIVTDLRQQNAQEQEQRIIDRAKIGLAVEQERGRAASTMAVNNARVLESISKSAKDKQGKQVNEATLKQISELASGRKMLSRMKEKYATATAGTGETAKQLIPGTDAQGYAKLKDTGSEILLRALTGAAAPEDEKERIRGFFPNLSDLEGSAKNKWDALDEMFAQKEAALIETLGQSGYDVAGLTKDTQKYQAKTFKED